MESPSAALLLTIANNLQRERQRVGISLTELARRAKISKSTLSQLEAAQGNPSVETLWALSVALDVTFADLVDSAKPSIRLIRAGQGPVVGSEKVDYIATLLSSSPPRVRRDIYQLVMQPGSDRHSEPHNPGVMEHVVLSTGRALIGLAENPVELLPGDYLSYPGDLPHIFSALEPDTRAVLVSEQP
ncbi:helix-turn-helix domain-containing protein [Psychromicrobium lacuslunae]|uniref:DNA-binding protein n=1 Tax=Psychromicrobium lacuslunae TaxID=1618207 RepID=A0A0D4BZB0_9MICC|nr:XRE family transcriptional regulator [Psychromicrobium lacuslunae]AJT41639.1 DNA-binding protein [Psychromicrobium lacuslunae]